MIIDLRSDGVSKPTTAMLEAMVSAEVGDDVFGDDPTVNELQRYAASLFGKEAALFCPSGVMCNQLALLTLVKPGNKYLCHELTHTYYMETGGPVSMNHINEICCPQQNGMFRIEELEPCMTSGERVKAIVVENTVNKGGGAYYSLAQLQQISSLSKRHGIKTHLDGARIFNALAETGDSPEEVGRLFDSISFCLSKGLGAPAGSMLAGDASLINNARKLRNKLGGGMRQAGYLAAAGLFALRNNLTRLHEDHHHARLIAEALSTFPAVTEVIYPVTNIVIAKTQNDLQKECLINRLAEQGVRAVSFGTSTLRMVTHISITDEMTTRVLKILNEIAHKWKEN
ncbi:MAG: aminotransferase class I/II-fold pyridoxal phosphate-dependent enzyme [Bacteroidia bacterium]|nr:aminotransferase class I/II-fold pyridoxal phosphate-dependent enzyme [Bacteroidia bacterium]MCZ2276538.1 aminotransferase class I/II-fold pyridoxal phosphate-dependent enzyme [Bacteroidia bacterium]